MYKRTLLSVALTLAFFSSNAALAAKTVSMHTGGDLIESEDITFENGTFKDARGDEHRASIRLNGTQGRVIVKNGNIESAAEISVRAENNATLTLGSNETKVINLTVEDNGYGLQSITQSDVTVYGDELTITAGKEGTGLLAQNNTALKEAPEDRATVTVNAKKTTIKADYGIIAWSNGKVVINSDLTVNARNVIDARGYSDVDINPDGSHTVVLKGDVLFESPKTDSGTFMDANVNINLVGENSSWEGNVYRDAFEDATEEEKAVKNFHLTLKDGATWNVDNVAHFSGNSGETALLPVNRLTLNGGVINATKSVDQKVTIETLDGKGGTLNVAAGKDAQGNLTSAKVHVNQIAEGSTPKIKETYSGITADDLSADKAADFDKLRSLTVGAADSTTAKGVEVTQQVVKEGEVVGELTRTTTADGTVGDIVDSTVKPDDGTAGGEVVEKPNTRQEAFREMAAMGALAWRHETNDLTKRMGELRDSPEGIGTWARLYGSSMDYGDQNLTTRSNSIQVGADADAGKGWKVGAAFSYTDSEMTYDAGSGDGDTYALAVYGTWFGENGQFVDLIGKYSRLSNDFSLNGFDGSYDNNALSLSAEFGWRFPLAKQGFIEPQAELTYGRIFGDDFNSAKGTRIEQDDFDSLIGRIGVRAGWKFAEDRGVVYARVSGLYDFLGDYDYTAKTSSVSRSYTEELGGGWVEYAVGGNFRFTDRSYGYVDVERTSGGEVDEDWRWNVGFRYVC